MAITFPACKSDRIVDIQAIHTFFHRIYENDFYFAGEAHNFWEVVFVLGGTVGVTADDEIFYLHQNQVIFHRPMEFHRIWAVKGKTPEVLIISFTGNMPELKSRVYTIPHNIPDNIFQIYQDANSVYDFASPKLSIIPKENSLLTAQIIVNRLEILFASIINENKTIDTTITSKSTSNYALIINILGKNLDKRLSVEEISRLCNMSVSALKKNFGMYSKLGIIKYHNTMKINKAKSMLMSGMSVKETAAALGFDDQNYFSTLFKKLAGASPSEYKK